MESDEASNKDLGRAQVEQTGKRGLEAARVFFGKYFVHRVKQRQNLPKPAFNLPSDCFK